MLFNSYEFIFLFLPLTWGIFFLAAKLRFTRIAIALLVGASIAFYAYWDVRYVPLLAASLLFNYFVGSRIEHTKQKKWLVFGLTVNLLLLAFFKYTGFFISTINSTAGLDLWVPQIVLPLGISFFTFTQIAFLVDAYRGETDHYSLLDYALFVTVFPHLIAGPILYHKDMLPQFSRLRTFVFSHKNTALGICFFVIGLFKKVIVADTLSPWVKAAFDRPAALSLIDSWIGALAYTFQIYFDFSGYSDMAVGLGLCFNLTLPLNFNSPYKATSIIDFWRRWHMSLSAFLKNYLYIALGGNRQGEWKRLRNLLLTMLLGGLWHGANWTFVMWGGLHGMYLVVNHLWRRVGMSIPKPASWGMTFLCVVVAWVFFRANSLDDAKTFLLAMTGAKGLVVPVDFAGTINRFLPSFIVAKTGTLQVYDGVRTEIPVLAALFGVVLFVPNTKQIVSHIRPNLWTAFGIALLGLISLACMGRVSEFLYFQF